MAKRRSRRATLTKQRGAYLPRGTPWEERGIALAKRLGVCIPPEPRTATSMIRMWAEIGMELADQEPEFGWGPGRPKGSNLLHESRSMTPAAIRKRRQREKPFREALLASPFATLLRDKK
jgi:hypothetical protein